MFNVVNNRSYLHTHLRLSIIFLIVKKIVCIVVQRDYIRKYVAAADTARDCGFDT